MNLGLLDEIYPIVNSYLHFEDFDQTGQIGWGNRSDRSSESCHFWCEQRHPPSRGSVTASPVFPIRSSVLVSGTVRVDKLAQVLIEFIC